ncbi:MAG: hypothetical protein CMF22_10350 [Idiomarinaceae bacterium]|nr:hypothetical protein [Idiomarinaceae bacterium]MBG23841.1 hypothetical protein [Idiomarinaceae bacterium]
MKRYVNRIVYAYDSEKIVKYLAHHIAWLLYHKEWPGSNLDHINGDATDNRIENLRKADGVVNNRNKKPDPFRKKPRGVRFYLSGKSKTPTFCAWYRDDNGKDVVLYRGRDYFEAICVRKSWENDTLMDGTSGYTERHFGR